MIRKHYEYVNNPFVNYNGRILLNPGDEERYPQKLQATIAQFIHEDRLPKQNIILISISDKCLKDELQVELQVA